MKKIPQAKTDATDNAIPQNPRGNESRTAHRKKNYEYLSPFYKMVPDLV